MNKEEHERLQRREWHTGARLTRARRFFDRCPDHYNLHELELAEAAYVKACTYHRKARSE